MPVEKLLRKTPKRKVPVFLAIDFGRRGIFSTTLTVGRQKKNGAGLRKIEKEKCISVSWLRRVDRRMTVSSRAKSNRWPRCSKNGRQLKKAAKNRSRPDRFQEDIEGERESSRKWFTMGQKKPWG